MTNSAAIQKTPNLEPAQDYAWLRTQGLQYIEQLGSRLWTDYNVHDPGITLLELLCYALTDLGYRADFPIADLLAAAPGKVADYRRQGFHTAREILTVNPLTVRDFRKLLIDIDGVKNGWLALGSGACQGVAVYADCVKGVLQYFPSTSHALDIKGLYDVLIEFDDVGRSGDLNSGKVLYNFAFNQGTPAASSATIELRLPSFQQLVQGSAQYAALRASTCTLEAVKVSSISGNKADAADVQPADQAGALRGVLYVTLTIDVLRDPSDATSAESLSFSNVPARVWFKSDAARRSLKLSDLKLAIEDASQNGLLGGYLTLLHEADAVMTRTQERLQSTRNLCEDWCVIKSVAAEDIAVCADVDLESGADIEAVLAEAYYQIAQYFSPDVRFRALKELLDSGARVEDLFEGSALANGYLVDDEVDSTNLKTVLHASDVINLLMDIPGVKAVRNFVFTRYDQEGRQAGASERWEMRVTDLHQVRLYEEASKFLLFKNGLPFLPDSAELHDMLQVVRGKHAQPKFSSSELDLPIPMGEYRTLSDYFPVQYQLPLTYGVGFDGLPASATPERVAQAKQLKAYLLFFEQLLVNYLAQLANVQECFAIDPAVSKTYFSRFISDSLVRGVESDIYAGFDADALQTLVESKAEQLERRNRFLDHLLSRFAESFSEYAVMLYRNAADKDQAREQLIAQKISLLKDLPQLSHDRAKAFDYTVVADACDASSSNTASLALRIKRLLGLADDQRVLIIEHLLLRPRDTVDPLLAICVSCGCDNCAAPDPYSFRLTVVLCGEGGSYNEDIAWRRYAENAIRSEVPAHIEAKICWVSAAQLEALRSAWCGWLAELAKALPDPPARASALRTLLVVFDSLKSVYPPAFLHDCVDGDDDNRVFLNRTIITSSSREK